MTREELVLAALATAKNRAFLPVHVQKLFFLIDKRMAEAVGGPHFNFAPYDYGPFDQDVYQELDVLKKKGLVEVASPHLGGGPRRYSLTSSGQERGEEVLSHLDDAVASGLSRLANFVRSLPFGKLVSAIYREYPEMKANSVFRE